MIMNWLFCRPRWSGCPEAASCPPWMASQGSPPMRKGCVWWVPPLSSRRYCRSHSEPHTQACLNRSSCSWPLCTPPTFSWRSGWSARQLSSNFSGFPRLSLLDRSKFVASILLSSVPKQVSSLSVHLLHLLRPAWIVFSSVFPLQSLAFWSPVTWFRAFFVPASCLRFSSSSWPRFLGCCCFFERTIANFLNWLLWG